MNNDELYDWFTETYESTNDDSDILKMKDVYKIFQDSEQLSIPSDYAIILG